MQQGSFLVILPHASKILPRYIKDTSEYFQDASKIIQ
jgi:hypothetical protein